VHEVVHHERVPVWHHLRRVLPGAGLLLLSAWLLVASTTGRRTPATQGPARPAPSAADKRLQDLMAGMHRSWDPLQRQQLATAASAESASLAPALRSLLLPDQHPPAEALVLAAGVPDHDLDLLLVQHCFRGPAACRAAAVRAAAAHAALDSPTLSQLLAEREPLVQQAAAAAALAQGEVPATELANCLCRLPAPLLDQLLPALPGRPVAGFGDALWSLTGDDSTAPAALQLLAKLELVAQYEAAATLRLADAPPPLAAMLLDFLGRRGTALQQPTAVERIAFDPAAAEGLRARAFACLELTRCGDLEAVPGQLTMLSPALRRAAARWLIARGDARGLDILFQDADTDSESALASRRLLGRLSGLSPCSEVDEFRAALAERHDLRLPPEAQL